MRPKSENAFLQFCLRQGVSLGHAGRNHHSKDLKGSQKRPIGPKGSSKNIRVERGREGLVTIQTRHSLAKSLGQEEVLLEAI